MPTHKSSFLQLAYALWCTALLWCSPFHTALSQERKFSFAQLTDIHLNPNNPGPEQDLISSVEQLNGLQDSLDFVLVTGDLADYGDRATILRTRNCLDRLALPYHTIMGNHETTWSDSGCMAFGEIFGSERLDFVHKGVLFVGFNSGPFMRMAHGHVKPEDITWLRARLKKWGRKKPVIVVTHYPMTQDVDNWQDVLDAVLPYNVLMFIGGHYHVFHSLNYAGIPGILGRANIADGNGKTGYTLYELSDTDDGRLQAHVYEQVEQERKFMTSIEERPLRPKKSGKEKKQLPEIEGLDFLRYQESALYAQAACQGDTCFVGDDKGQLSAYLLETNKRLWRYSSRQRIVGGPAVSEGRVCFGSADSTIYALQSRNGHIAWTMKCNGPVLGTPFISGDTLFIGASDHCFRAIDVTSGRLLWSYDQVEGYMVTRPLVYQGRVIFGAWDGTLYALDTRNGQLLWQWKNPKQGLHYSPAQVWPVASGDKCFIAAPDRFLTAIDIHTGETRWRTNESVVRESLGISEDGTLLFAKTMNDSVVAYSATSDAPQKVWSSCVGFGYEHAPSMPIEVEGVVYGGTCSGQIWAVDARTGAPLWLKKMGNALVNTPARGRLKSGKPCIVFTSSDGSVAVYGK